MKGNDFFIEASKRPPFSKLHPRLASFFKDYMSREKVVCFNDQFVLNTHFPPFPSPAFDHMVENFLSTGDSRHRVLYSVTLAVTNRCDYRCWHCYNSDRSTQDISIANLKQVAMNLQDMGAVMVTLTGGEPLLRDDLEEIVGLFDEKSCLILGTTGSGFDNDRALELKKGGLFGVGISLDSADEEAHDQLRGIRGAFKTAVKGIRIAADTGLYPYVVSVATRDFLEAGRFWSFLGFARDIGAREVHLLEPCAVGRLAGREDVLLGAAERQLILKYQEEAADKVDLPVLSSYAYLESPETFGCGAGLTHLYIDGSGEVCPCQLVPISFGNILADPLGTILERMGEHFIVPRTACCGKVLARHIPLGKLPTNLLESEKICEKYLPKHHKVPGFFKALKESQDEVGIPELAEAYNQIHESYDQFWLDKAALPIETLVEAIPIENCREIFEAGCGTGYATALLSRSLHKDAHLMAVDLSEGMLEEAKKRLGSQELCQVTLKLGDALEEMEKEGPFDLVFSSWVLGYIPLSPFFNAAYRSLRSQGLLAFLVHLENSPREPLEIFGKIVGRDPSVLTKRIAFDFPKSLDHLESKLQNAGFQILHSFRDAITFSYSTPEEVLRHLLKSGAGTAFYEALEPERRGDLENDFLEMLSFRNRNQPNFNVIHDYLSCLAKKI